MKKLSLSLDDLRVESFETNSWSKLPSGTVFGNFDVSGGNNYYCNTQVAGCGSPTNAGPCIYPTNSCLPGQTIDQVTCECLYPKTDVHVCCSTETCTGNTGLC